MSSSPAAPIEGLTPFLDTHYARAERAQSTLPFEFIPIDSLREDHQAILAHARRALSHRRDADTLITAAALVLLAEVAPLEHGELTDAFGEDVATLVASAATPFDRDCGDAILWEASLRQLAEAPQRAQCLRLALLLGQITHSPDALGHLPFWAREAETVKAGDPALWRRVMERLEAAAG